MNENDMSQNTIKELFYRQIRELTIKANKSFDYQFSDRWL